MPDITLRSISVMIDGGAHDGQLVLCDGHLVAVLSRVTSAETAGGHGQAEGWFLEAGFGPCGPLTSVMPPVFAHVEEAIAWVRNRLDTGLSAP